jgi:hypothetical protein
MSALLVVVVVRNVFHWKTPMKAVVAGDKYLFDNA